MQIRKKAFIVIMLLILLIFLFYKKSATKIDNDKTPLKKNIDKTIIINYEQKYIPKQTLGEEGDCWTMSIAAPNNEKAWRCKTVGEKLNQIFDPCFEINKKQVVCDVDPLKAKSGFTLNLSKEIDNILKTERKELEEVRPWIVKLDNGLFCRPLTGTAGSFNGNFYYYVCDYKTVLISNNKRVTFDTSNDKWKVKVVYFKNSTQEINEKAEKIEDGFVSIAWN